MSCTDIATQAATGRRCEGDDGMSSDRKDVTTIITRTTPQLQIPRSATREQALDSLLLYTSIHGLFADAIIYTYSRRTSLGEFTRVDRALPTYTNSAILKYTAPDYFIALLSGDFSDETRVFTDEYDYLSDSDLDDDDEELQTAVRRPGLPADSKAEGSQAEPPAPAIIAKPSPPTSLLDVQPNIVSLESVAYKTFQAFVFYATRGKIRFAPLQSQHSSEQVVGTAASAQDPYIPPACSPKSIYRLAHMKTEDIRTKVTPSNVVTELASTISVRYPDVRDIAIDVFMRSTSHPEVMSAASPWISSIAGPSAGNVIAELISRLMMGQHRSTGHAFTSSPFNEGALCPNCNDRARLWCPKCNYY